MSDRLKQAIDKGKELRFDDIKDLSDSALKKLFKDVDTKTITIAFKDTKEDLTERVLPNLGAKTRKKFDELQSDLKKVKKSDIKKYQKEIEDKLNKLFKK